MVIWVKYDRNIDWKMLSIIIIAFYSVLVICVQNDVLGAAHEGKFLEKFF